MSKNERNAKQERTTAAVDAAHAQRVAEIAAINKEREFRAEAHAATVKGQGVTMYHAGLGTPATYSFSTNGWKCLDDSHLLWLKQVLRGPFANADELRVACARFGLVETLPLLDAPTGVAESSNGDTLTPEVSEVETPAADIK